MASRPTTKRPKRHHPQPVIKFLDANQRLILVLECRWTHIKDGLDQSEPRQKVLLVPQVFGRRRFRIDMTARELCLLKRMLIVKEFHLTGDESRCDCCGRLEPDSGEIHLLAGDPGAAKRFATAKAKLATTSWQPKANQAIFKFSGTLCSRYPRKRRL